MKCSLTKSHFWAKAQRFWWGNDKKGKMSSKENSSSVWDLIGRQLGRSNLATAGMTMAQVGQLLCRAITDVGGSDAHAIALLNDPDKLQWMAKIATGMAKAEEKPHLLKYFGISDHQRPLENLLHWVRVSGRAITNPAKQAIAKLEIDANKAYRPAIIEADWFHKDLWTIGVARKVAESMGLSTPPQELALRISTESEIEDFDWLVVCHDPIKSDGIEGFTTGGEVGFEWTKTSLRLPRADRYYNWSDEKGKGGFVFLASVGDITPR